MCGILFELDNPCLLSSNLFNCDSFFYIICFPYGPLRKGTSLKANMMPTREWRHPLFSTVSTEDLKVRYVQELLDHFVLNFQVKNFPLLKLDPNKSVPGVGGRQMESSPLTSLMAGWLSTLLFHLFYAYFSNAENLLCARLLEGYRYKSDISPAFKKSLVKLTNNHGKKTGRIRHLGEYKSAFSKLFIIYHIIFNSSVIRKDFYPHFIDEYAKNVRNKVNNPRSPFVHWTLIFNFLNRSIREPSTLTPSPV